MTFVTVQVDLLLKGGGCGVAASPPHHTPLSPCTLSSYWLSYKYITVRCAGSDKTILTT